MVTIFFVVSGFAISYKALRQMRNRQFAPVLETLASSVFRRGTRLYLPTNVSSLISMMLRVAQLYPVNPWPPLTLPSVQPTFGAQLYDWSLNWLVLINPFQPINVGDPYPPPYDSHLWSKSQKVFFAYFSGDCCGRGRGRWRKRRDVCCALILKVLQLVGPVLYNQANWFASDSHTL